ncbi:hypothetical protein GCM10007170_45980 [Arthrobacter liuii]|uniref:Transposase IS701-like DDE domain-containing protein n=1 Tax=Arthrobacter liuii TaxID=1476996 RepID=A0ABQ2B161_9MICC|nr:hypothetical protein GCM10007170_45980 [Arthrobacter liuii]
MVEVGELIGATFARSEPRANAVEYVRGLISEEERKNSWTLSERAGHRVPDRMQRLLSSTDWDPDGLRDDLRSYVLEKIGDPDGVLVVDETGFLKKGRRSAGVTRQYSGTAGRVENCQIGVFLTYATKHGRTFLDRELYLPKEWTDDPDRCAGAGIPEERGFKTKPALAIDMIERALDSGVQAKWAAGDAVYGQYHRLRRTLEERGIYYVLAVPVSQRVAVKDDTFLGTEKRADAAIADLIPTAWRTRSAGDGSKGIRDYTWARVRINGAEDGQAEHWLLGRRNLANPSELAYFICHTPNASPWPKWPGSPGSAGRSRKPSRPPRAKPDSTTTRSASTPAGTATSPCPCSPTPSSRRQGQKRGAGTGPKDLVELSLPEIRHLITRLAWACLPDPKHVLNRSQWRRKHQADARQHHYRKRQSQKQTRL